MSKYKFHDLSGFPDCSALSQYGKCTRLNVLSCQGQKCPFMRTREEDFHSIQCVHRRLSGLDSSIQSRIANKYYRGSMPWKEVQEIKKFSINKKSR